MSRGRTTRLTIVVIVSCFVAITVVSNAADLNRPPSQHDLRFRRIEIPVDRVEQFVGGLIPRPRAEFEELIREKAESPPTFTSAVYFCEFVDGDTIRGKCEMHKTTEVETKQTLSSASNAYFEIGGQLAMQNPIWFSSGRRRPAIAGSHGEQTIVVNSPGAEAFAFSFSHRGQRNNDRIWFRLNVPTALSHQLKLSLPAGTRIRSNQGVVDKMATNGADLFEWSVQWGGAEPLQFVLEPSELEHQKEVSARLESSYQFSGNTLRLNSVVSLDTSALRLTPETLTVTADSTLSLIKAVANGQSVPWTAIPNRENTFVLELPETRSPSRVIDLQLNLIADCPRGELFRLPRLRVDGRWTGEVVRWEVEQPLEVSDVLMQDCRCRSVKNTLEDVERIEFDMESEFSELQLQVDISPHELDAEALVQVELKENSVVADVEVRFEPLGREVFDISVDITRGWAVVADSVDAVADSASLGLRESVIDQYEAPQGDKRSLSVRLNQGAATNRPVFLRFRVRNDVLKKESSLKDLVPLSFPDVARLSVWLHGKDSPGLELVTSGAEHVAWRRLDDPERPLPEWLKKRIVESRVGSTLQLSNEFLVEDQPDSRLAKMSRQSKASPVRVQTRTNVFVGEDDTRYTLELLVDPLGNALNKLNVTFSEPVREAARLWRLNDRFESPSVQRINRFDTDPENLCRFEIRFEPIAEPFRLQFEDTIESKDNLSLPLVSVVGATSGRGVLAVYTSGPVGVDVVAGNDLSAVPFSLLQSEDADIRSLRAAYSYDDTSMTIPSVEITPTRLPVRATLTAWRCAVRSFYAEKGRPRHRADYYLENHGASKITLTFPTGIALDDVEIDGEKLSPQPRLENAVLSIPLPQDKEFPCVTVRYVQPERSLRSIDWLRPTVPTFSATAMQTTWQVWLPNDFRTYSSQTESSNNTWLGRIAGPFANRNGTFWGVPILRKIRRRLIPSTYDLSVIVEQTMETLLGQDWLSRQDALRQQTVSRPMTWGPRLFGIQEALSRSRPDLEMLIDRQELRRVGVFPESALPTSRYSSPRQIGIDRFRQAGLAVVVDEPHLILTSSSEIQERLQSLKRLDGTIVVGNSAWFTPTRLQSLHEWQENSAPRLWHPSSDALEVGLQQGGWFSRRGIIDTQASPWKIYHRDTVLALACSVFAIGYAIGWWLIARSRRRWFFSFAVATALALAMPQPGSSFAIAFAWAVLLSGLARYVMEQRAKNRTRTPLSPLRIATTKAAVGLLACTLSFASSNSVQAQAALSSEAEEVVGERFVYFPINADQILTDVVYLPRDFHSDLKLRRSDEQVQPDYLYRKAIYSGDWPSDENSNSMTLTVGFNVITFVPHANIKLPEFDGAQVDEESLRVDRSPVDLLENKQDGTFAVELGRPGNHRVTFKLSVPLSRIAEREQLSLTIPPIADAELQLNLPREIQSIEVPSAIGDTQANLNRGTVTADLGPCSELSVFAARLPGTGGNSSGFDQLTVLSINENYSELETRFVFSVAPFPLTLQVDPRLEPIIESNALLKWDLESLKLNVGIVDVESTIRFRMPTSSIGRFSVPTVVPIRTSPRTSRLAVLTSSSLVARADSDTLASLLQEEFDEGWGGLDEVPSLVFATENQTPTLLVTRATHPESWTSEIVYLFDAAQTRFEVNAQFLPVDPGPSRVTIRRLTADRSMRIQNVEATNSLGVPLRLRWRRKDDQLVLVFLDQPDISPAISIDLFIEGELEQTDGLQQLPLVLPSESTNDIVAFSQSVLMYKSTSVNLDVDPLAQVALSMDQGGIADRDGYRYVGSWSEEFPTFGSEAPVVFAVNKQPAQRTLSGSLTTKMNHDSDGWSVEVSANVSSSDGIVDAIHFDVPQSLAAVKPRAMEGDVELRVDDISSGIGLDRRILTVWLPPGAASNSLPRSITFVSRLDQEQTRLPDIQMLNVSLLNADGQRQQTVELPMRSFSKDDDSSFNWSTKGLTQLSSDSRSIFYRASQRDFAAELEVESEVKPRVFLLENSFEWRTTSEFVAMSQFDWSPSSRSNVLVELPPKSKLIQLTCDDRPVYHQEIGNSTTGNGHTIRVSLGSAPWPQRMRVVFSGTADSRLGGVVKIQAPRLLSFGADESLTSIPISKVLWNVYSPDVNGPGVPVSADDEVLEVVEYDSHLIRSFSELWNNSAVAIRERPRAEATAWLASWVNRFEEVFARAQSQNVWEDDPAMQTMNQLLTSFPDVFDPELYGISKPEAKKIQPYRLWSESQWVSGPILRCSSISDVDLAFPSLEIEYHNSSRGTTLARYIFAALFACCAFVLPRWEVGKHAAMVCLGYPHAIGIVVGLLWFLLLSPSFIGFLLSMFFAIIWSISAFRPRRRHLPK